MTIHKHSYLFLILIIGFGGGCLIPQMPHAHDFKGHGDAGTYLIRSALYYGVKSKSTNELFVVQGKWFYSDNGRGVKIYFSKENCQSLEDFLGRTFIMEQDKTEGVGSLQVYSGSNGGEITLHCIGDESIVLIFPSSDWEMSR
jgi:hypothetical protein